MSRRPKKKRAPGNRDLRQDEKAVYGGADRVVVWNPYAAPAVCVFLLLAVVLVFGQTVRYGFINYDDNDYVYENPQVEHGLTAQGIAWAFTQCHALNWHPLTWLSHMLDCQIYGLSPGGHHLSNVLLHAATAILLFLVLRRMTGDLWPSAFVAAVFAVHPLRVESVAWVAERKDVLSGLFFMLTLWAYLGYVRHPFSLVRYLTVMVFFALGLMAKPMLVTMPFVLLLLDYWPLGRMAPAAAEDQPVFGSRRTGRFSIPLRLAMEKIPLLVLAAASCAATLWAQSGAIVGNEYMPLSLRIGNAVVSYVAYLGQMFYPAGLAVLYPHPDSSLPVWKVAGALLLLSAVSGGVVALWRRCPYLLVGWLWYLGMLLPVIGLVQVGMQAMADRYTYLTQIGLYMALAWGVVQISRTWPYRDWACGVASALVLAVLTGCAWRQTSYWRDSETLWTHTLECTSQNYMAHNNLGSALVQAGRLPEAIEHYKQALVLKPDYADAHNNLGYALIQAGRPQEAIEPCERALRLKPDCPEAHYNLGNALVQTGRPDKAIEHYQQALVLEPNYSEAHNNLGLALADAGRVQEAMAHYQQALVLKPDFTEAHNNMGNALFKTGRLPEAIEHYQQALRLKPDFTAVYYNLALCHARMHQSSEAMAAAQKGLKLARSQGQTKQVKQIEDWLNSYRDSLSKLPNAPPSSESVPLPP